MVSLSTLKNMFHLCNKYLICDVLAYAPAAVAKSSGQILYVLQGVFREIYNRLLQDDIVSSSQAGSRLCSFRQDSRAASKSNSFWLKICHHKHAGLDRVTCS